jgi:hypothetical protein
MKSFLWIVLFGCLVLSACATMGVAPEVISPADWTSSDPSTIPYDIRLKLLEKGNLVVNPSFEQGQVIAGDARKTFSIKGWEVVGSNVRWVDRTSDGEIAADVHHGEHAVKVSRVRVNELDAAEGILSDYISVIPGNYDFTYSIRLKDIYGSRQRMALQLGDTILVRVLYFDADKQPLDPGYYNPVSKTLIDNSDKSYTFADYWSIDDFPWGKVRARTYNYPFSEGDVPDRTRFVRLFFGLNGNGSMWVDDIVYRYSKWNFTTLERFKPYFGRQPMPAERIVPTPQKFQAVKDVAYYDAGSSASDPAVIVLPANPAPAEQTAAAILQKKINAVLARVLPDRDRRESKIRVVQKFDSLSTLPDAKLVFSIGQNSFYQNVQPNLPWQAIRGRQQGYIIGAEQIGNRHCVFLIGETPLANYYAAATALQLFENDKFVYHSAAIVDFPDFLGRAYAFKKWKNMSELEEDLNNIERLSLYKLNKAYVGSIPADKIWRKTAGTYLDGITAAGQRCRQSGVMSLAVMANPYSHFPFEPSAENLSEESRYTWTHSSPESFDKLKDFYKIALDAGAQTIMLLADDRVPHYGKNRQNYALYTEEDKQRFINLQNAQAHLIKDLKQWLDREYPGTRLEFCPPWYSNEHVFRSAGKAEPYFKELIYQIPREVAIVWTGPTIRSLSVDTADLHYFRSLIGRWPMFWDNTLYARSIDSKGYGGYTANYPGKVRMCNLFEPYDTYRPAEFYQYSDSRQMYTNGQAFSEIYRIKYATVADYGWNTAAYDPEFALWKVLCAAYGPDGGEALLRFNDAYYGLYGVCLQMASAGVNPKHAKDGRQYLAKMADELERLTQILAAGGTLLPELEKLLDQQKKRFENSLADDNH